MKILTHALFLSPVGGIESATLQDSVALAGRGHSISLMYGVDGTLRADFEAAGIGLRGPFPFAFDPRRAVRDVRGFISSARWARKQGADVLWVNRIEHLIWGQFVSRWAGLPLVCTLHNAPAYRNMGLVGFGVSRFVAVSEFVANSYSELGIARERITVLYNAIPAEKFPRGGIAEQNAARAVLDLPTGVPIVLCYGQMSVEKGLVVLLRAWREIWPNTDGAILLLIDSSSAAPLSNVDPAVAEELRALHPDSVRVYPATSDVLPYLHASDVVAFPTLLPEAFGRVVIEGMATGRPVVASRIGAVPEILSGPMDRFLVDPASVEQLAARLVSLLDWRIREPGLGDECAEWVTRRFPFTDHVDRLETLFEEQRG